MRFRVNLLSPSNQELSREWSEVRTQSVTDGLTRERAIVLEDGVNLLSNKEGVREAPSSFGREQT